MRTIEAKRAYQREYMRQKKRVSAATLCPCGKRAVKIVAGNEGVCERCLAIEQAIYFHPHKTNIKPDEVPAEEAESRGTRYWKEKLAFWLPNPQPGWGSLAWLEGKLSAIGCRPSAEAQRI